MAQGKRGQLLEQMITNTNAIYDVKGMALVHKVPTPWNVSFDKRRGRVKRAFPQEKSTVDFTGVSHGRSLAFEAKVTNSRTSFPLSNFEKHQIQYLATHKQQGGISFTLVMFEKHNEVFYLNIDDLIEWWNGQFDGKRKSIPYKWFKENCDRVISKNGVALDYLQHTGTVYKKKKTQ